MARTGRPPKPEAERLSEPVQVRLTRPAYDELYRRAQAERKAVPVLIRELLSEIKISRSGTARAILTPDRRTSRQ